MFQSRMRTGKRRRETVQVSVGSVMSGIETRQKTHCRKAHRARRCETFISLSGVNSYPRSALIPVRLPGEARPTGVKLTQPTRLL